MACGVGAFLVRCYGERKYLNCGVAVGSLITSDLAMHVDRALTEMKTELYDSPGVSMSSQYVYIQCNLKLVFNHHSIHSFFIRIVFFLLRLNILNFFHNVFHNVRLTFS